MNAIASTIVADAPEELSTHEPVPEGNFFRGVAIGCLICAPFWSLMGWALWAATH